MLSPYRILDLTDEKGLFCGQLLGSLGADVIKIEKHGGDSTRNIGPFSHDEAHPEKSLFWFAYNNNKRGITLDIETSEGQDIFRNLVTKADAVIESFPPGYLDRLGLGYADLAKINQGLVMTSISAFGQSGPYRDFKASDLICWAMGGALFTAGSSPGKPPARISHVPQSFLLAGADAAWGTVMALYWKRVSGEGQQVDISIQQSVESSAPNSQILFQVTGESFQQLNGSYAVLPARVDTTPPIWEVKDGYVAYTVFTGETGARMNAPVIQWMTEDGMADDFLKNLDWNKFEWIGASRDDIDSIAQQHIQFFKTKTMKQLVEEGVKQRGAAIQPMYTIREVVEHPQLQARHYWQELEHPELGASIEYPGGFCKPSTTSCGLHRRAPLIGEHNQEIYHDELGLSLEQIDSLKQKGVI